MALSRTISIIVVGTISIGVLFYLADYGVSVRAVPPLAEYMASTTRPLGLATTTRSYGDESQASVAWFASSTVMRQLFGGNVATSTPIVPQKKPSLLKFYAPKGVIYSYVARTPATRERGLSGTAALDPDQGMLFIFPKAGEYAFWMKDMDFSIDIVWITADKKVAGISENASPKSYPKTFESPKPVQFVLEVPAGSAKKFGLKEGSTVSF